MAWPYTPLTTYLENGPPMVDKTDLNGIQSAINTINTAGVYQPQGINQTPIATYKDLVGTGTIPYVIDHNALPMGKFSELREDWQVAIASFNPASAAVLTNNTRWNTSGANTALIASTSIGAAYPSSSVDVSISNTNASTATLYTTGLTRTDYTYSVIVLEWDLFVSNHGQQYVLYMGLGNGTDIGGTNSIHIRNSGSNSDWFAESTVSGSTTTVDTLTSPQDTTWQRFRIEVYGSTSGIGAASGKIKFYWNEVLEATIAGALPVLNPMNIAFKLTASAGSQAMKVAVGPVLCRWIRWDNTKLTVAL